MMNHEIPTVAAETNITALTHKALEGLSMSIAPVLTIGVLAYGTNMMIRGLLGKPAKFDVV